MQSRDRSPCCRVILPWNTGRSSLGSKDRKAHDASRTAKRTADHDATFDDHAWREELSVRPILPSTMKDTSWISAVMLTTSANTLNGECDEAPASEHVGTDVVPNPCSIIQKYRSGAGTDLLR